MEKSNSSMYKFDMTALSRQSPVIHHPCGRLLVGQAWGRDRETSLRLRDHELWLVWHGRGWMASADRRFDLRPGVCVWMRPGGIYDAGVADGQSLGFTFIHFDGQAYQQPPEYLEVDDVAFFDDAMRRIVNTVGHAPASQWGRPAQAETAHSFLLGALLSDLYLPRHRTAGDMGTAQWRRLDEVVEAMNASLQPSRPVAEWARMMGVTPAHFSRLFASHVGMSPQQYQTQTRLRQGRHLLVESNLAIGQIAETLGYCDAFAFSRQFKSHVGQSPSEYRASCALAKTP